MDRDREERDKVVLDGEDPLLDNFLGFRGPGS